MSNTNGCNGMGCSNMINFVNNLLSNRYNFGYWGLNNNNLGFLPFIRNNNNNSNSDDKDKKVDMSMRAFIGRLY